MEAKSPPKLADLLTDDPYLEPFTDKISARYTKFKEIVEAISAAEGSLEQFSLGHKKLGFVEEQDGIRYREWCPGAAAVHVTGDFNQWDRQSHPLKRDEFGVWEIFLPHKDDGSPAIEDGSIVKVSVHTPSGKTVDRMSPWIQRAVQTKESPLYQSVYTKPSEYKWKSQRPPKPKSPIIYEAHVGISSRLPEVASYRHFADNVVPRIAKLGYNCIQLMAIMEHAYYGSFGYQVTSFFAASSRFGPSDDLKYLVDCAHGHGLFVLLDVVHSHASKNTLDGLNEFDGTDACFFHAGSRGVHSQWDSRLFNYGAWEVQRFLLSNLRYYMEEFMFDGFRFDGVTSMLYLHHGLGRVFAGYGDYFDESVDVDACIYMMLANQMIHSVFPDAITVAEDVSGMPALCRSVEEGGLGFDYRLAMAVPDVWIKYLKEIGDEAWNIGHLVHVLSNRRYKEPCIAYAESHDQALVGDKTLAFWLMDKEMYSHMSTLSELTPVIDRGLSLHKMIRLVTYGLGGEAYLNFIGNEFGHPEWLDFPREGNQESYQHARRQWNLVDDDLLRYKFLNNFDGAMHQAQKTIDWLGADPGYVSCKHEDDKVIVFERGGAIFAFNFHTHKSFTDYRIGTGRPGKYKVLLSSDDKEFGGHDRLDKSVRHLTEPNPWHDRPHSLLVYLPCRTAIIYTVAEKTVTEL